MNAVKCVNEHLYFLRRCCRAIAQGAGRGKDGCGVSIAVEQHCDNEGGAPEYTINASVDNRGIVFQAAGAGNLMTNFGQDMGLSPEEVIDVIRQGMPESEIASHLRGESQPSQPGKFLRRLLVMLDELSPAEVRAWLAQLLREMEGPVGVASAPDSMDPAVVAEGVDWSVAPCWEVRVRASGAWSLWAANAQAWLLSRQSSSDEVAAITGTDGELVWVSPPVGSWGTPAEARRAARRNGWETRNRK